MAVPLGGDQARWTAAFRLKCPSVGFRGLCWLCELSGSHWTKKELLHFSPVFSPEIVVFQPDLAATPPGRHKYQTTTTQIISEVTTD